MTNWKSPEESEAWWSEFQNLKEKVASLEKRLVETAKRAFASYIVVIMTMTPTAKQKYVSERASHYAQLIDKSKDEKEISNHLDQFIKEVLTYAKSG